MFSGIICAMLCIFCFSCGPRTVQIDPSTRRTIDTLAAQQIQALRPDLDSLCIVKTDSLIAVISDSILVVRREEMRKLLGR